MNLRSVLRSRTVIVAIWLAAAFQFLWWQQPGFWRTPYLRYEEAQALVADRRTEEAIAEMAQALAEDPGNAGYATFKGFLELAAPRPAEAEASFRRALELTADDIDARLGLAESLVRQERAAEGLQALAALDDQTPDMEQRLRRRVIHALAGDYDGALGDPAVFDNGHADWLRLREGLRWAMAAADWDTAVLLADRVLAATDNVAVRHEAMNEKAQALRSLERLDEALALFEQVPTPENLAARAELSLQLERYTAAARLFGERRAADPANADLLRPSAYAFERARQFENAIAAYRTLLDREDTVETRLLLVTLLNSLKRHAEAWETLAPLPRPADDLGVLRLQASTAFWAGRLRKADDLFRPYARGVLATRRPGESRAISAMRSRPVATSRAPSASTGACSPRATMRSAGAD